MATMAAEAEKKYGAGTMVPSGSIFHYQNCIPLGHLIGDLALLGGLPEGQASMFLGYPGGGKTTQAMRCVAQAQKKYPKGHGLWVDSERTFDPGWARSHGVDLARLTVVRTVAGEDAVDLMKTAVANSPELVILVLDSVNETIPLKEYADSVGDNQVALLPRLMGRMCSALTASCEDRRVKGYAPVTQIFINQWRNKIGGMARDPKVIPGGMQLAHYASTHLEFKGHTELGKDNDQNETPYVVNHTFVVRRTKTASSIRTGEYAVVVGPDHPLPIGSYDEAGTILSQAKKIGLWVGAGANQSFVGYPDVHRTMDAGKAWLEANPKAALELKRSIIAHRRERVGLPPTPFDGYLLRWR